MTQLRLGTSAFTAAGWPGKFYPEGTKPADYLSYYSRCFDTVEVDATFYRSPSPAATKKWYRDTPPAFQLAAKVPQVITHEKVMVDCDYDLKEFLHAMDQLGEKLGPLLFQFPYFNKKRFETVDGFLEKLKPFVQSLPDGYKFALEVRNKGWLVPRFLDVLRSRRIALALIDHPWMSRPRELFAKADVVTGDSVYVRWLGDRKGIEEVTKIWDKTIVDRTRDLEEWVEVLRRVHSRGIPIYGYANNHYAGHGPDTIRLFWELWKRV